MKSIIKLLTSQSIISFIVLTSIIIASCSNDDDQFDSSASVVGVWRHNFEDGYQLLTLENNGTYTLVEFDFVSGDWTESGTYYVKDNILTLIDHSLKPDNPEYRMVYTIIKLTSKQMIIRYEGSYVGQYPEYYDKYTEDWSRVN